MIPPILPNPFIFPLRLTDPVSATRAADTAAAAALKPHKHHPLGAAAAPIQSSDVRTSESSAGAPKNSLPLGESDPVVMQDWASAELQHHSISAIRSHEDMVRELDELLRANDRTCEKSDNEIWADEEPPMFLRRTG